MEPWGRGASCQPLAWFFRGFIRVIWGLYNVIQGFIGVMWGLFKSYKLQVITASNGYIGVAYLDVAMLDVRVKG